MLLSMTGFGEARRQDDRGGIVVEVRTVNNRHFKLSARISEPYGPLESEIESLVRQSVRRGTVQLTLKIDRPRRADDYRINAVALETYREQASRILGAQFDHGLLLQLPGVVEEEAPDGSDIREEWLWIRDVIIDALEMLQRARAEEGKVMEQELAILAKSIRSHLAIVIERGPEVVRGYRDRLLERVRGLLADQGVALAAADLVREVAILAERADIAEETVRLRAHLDQFESILGEPESGGRRLEFVVQEMGRETNTIGSKANDVAISREVVGIKGYLENIRELIQNVE